MTRLERLYLAAAAVLVASIVTLLVLQAGPLPAAIIGGAMTLALPAWALTSLRRPPDPARVLPVYVLTCALLMVHIVEEVAFDFGPRIGELTGTGWTREEFTTTIVLLGPVLWITGALAVARRHPLGGFLAWFVFIGMVLGEPVHLLFPVLEGGRYAYFPGLWTALLPMVPALWGIQLLVRDSRAPQLRGPER